MYSPRISSRPKPNRHRVLGSDVARSPHLTVIAAIVVVSAFTLGACSTTDAAVPVEEPITVVEIGGTEISRLTLSGSAADRLDIQTATVESAGAGMAVSSAAVMIDPQGLYWVYTNPEPLVYVREEIRPVREAGGEAFFAVGPAAGATVVIVGVPELYGAEFGIGK